MANRWATSNWKLSATATSKLPVLDFYPSSSAEASGGHCSRQPFNTLGMPPIRDAFGFTHARSITSKSSTINNYRQSR